MGSGPFLVLFALAGSELVEAGRSSGTWLSRRKYSPIGPIRGMDH